jgi:hypothetical protein
MKEETKDCYDNPYKYSSYLLFLQLQICVCSMMLAGIVLACGHVRDPEVDCHGRKCARSMLSTRPCCDVASDGSICLFNFDTIFDILAANIAIFDIDIYRNRFN